MYYMDNYIIFLLIHLTGYIVFSGCRRSNGVQGLRVIVQSNRDPQYVENRVEAFLHSMEVSAKYN